MGIAKVSVPWESQIKGDARSKVTSSPEGLRFRFDIAGAPGNFCGWYRAARNEPLRLDDKNVLRLELKGSPQHAHGSVPDRYPQ